MSIRSLFGDYLRLAGKSNALGGRGGPLLSRGAVALGNVAEGGRPVYSSEDESGIRGIERGRLKGALAMAGLGGMMGGGGGGGGRRFQPVTFNRRMPGDFQGPPQRGQGGSTGSMVMQAFLKSKLNLGG